MTPELLILLLYVLCRSNLETTPTHPRVLGKSKSRPGIGKSRPSRSPSVAGGMVASHESVPAWRLPVTLLLARPVCGYDSQPGVCLKRQPVLGAPVRGHSSPACQRSPVFPQWCSLQRPQVARLMVRSAPSPRPLTGRMVRGAGAGRGWPWRSPGPGRRRPTWRSCDWR
jgi:hypothetical protein